MKCRDLKGG